MLTDGHTCMFFKWVKDTFYNPQMRPDNNYQQKQPVPALYKATTICLFNLLFSHCTCINPRNAKIRLHMGEQKGEI